MGSQIYGFFKNSMITMPHFFSWNGVIWFKGDKMKRVEYFAPPACCLFVFVFLVVEEALDGLLRGFLEGGVHHFHYGDFAVGG